jgi:hypothetical protein
MKTEVQFFQSRLWRDWPPASAGVTVLETFEEILRFYREKKNFRTDPDLLPSSSL